MWLEGMASRCPDEIGSCIMKFVQMKTAEGVDNLVGFSDSCGGQNRHFKMAMLGSYTVSSGAASFEQRFMKSGHSFLPNDAHFGVIERAKGSREIFIRTLDVVGYTGQKKRPVYFCRHATIRVYQSRRLH